MKRIIKSLILLALAAIFTNAGFADFNAQECAEIEAKMSAAPDGTPWGRDIYKMPEYWSKKYPGFFVNALRRDVINYSFDKDGKKIRAFAIALEESKYSKEEKDNLFIKMDTIVSKPDKIDEFAMKYLPYYENKLEYVEFNEEKMRARYNPEFFIKEIDENAIFVRVEAENWIQIMWNAMFGIASREKDPNLRGKKIEALSQIKQIFDSGEYERLTNTAFKFLNLMVPKEKNNAAIIFVLYSILEHSSQKFASVKHIDVKPNIDVKKKRLMALLLKKRELGAQQNEANRKLREGRRLATARDYTTGKGTSFEYTTDNEPARRKGKQLISEAEELINGYKEVSNLINALSAEIAADGRDSITLKTKRWGAHECVIIEVTPPVFIAVSCKNRRMFEMNLDELDDETRAKLK